jgi:predicted Zn-dependent protease
MNARLFHYLCSICATGFFSGALLAQSNYLVHLSSQARQLMAAGKYEEACRIYAELVQDLPENPGLSFDLGVARYMAGDEQKAIAAFDRVLKLDPHNVPAHLYLGYAELSLGEPAEALAPLEAVVHAQPANLDARTSLADTLLALGKFNGAAENYRLVAKSEPQSAEVWYGLGRCYQSLSQAAFERLGEIAPGSAYWLALVAESNAKATKYSSAFYLYRQALDKMPGLYGVHRAVAQIYRATGHPQWAQVETSREHQPDCARQALECDFLSSRFEQVASAPGESPEVLYWKSRAYDRLAFQAFLRLTKLPPSPQLHELVAELHEATRDYPVAAQEWAKAYQLSHQDPEIGKRLAIALLRVYNNRGAEQLLETLLRERPRSADVNYFLGYALVNLQKPAQAIPYLRTALGLDPTLLRSRAELGRAYLQTGQDKLAIPYLKAALALDGDGSLHYQLAKAYMATGQRQLAGEMLQVYQRMHQADAQNAETLKQQVRVTPPK